MVDFVVLGVLLFLTAGGCVWGGGGTGFGGNLGFLIESVYTGGGMLGNVRLAFVVVASTFLGHLTFDADATLAFHFSWGTVG